MASCVQHTIVGATAVAHDMHNGLDTGPVNEERSCIHVLAPTKPASNPGLITRPMQVSALKQMPHSLEV